MIDNVNTFIHELKTSEFGKATRKSAQTIWKANFHAFETTRDELGKVVQLAVKEGEKLTRRSRARTEKVVGGLQDVAEDRVTDIEQRFQKGMSKVIHEIGLPTADEVEKLSRRVDRLQKEVKAKAKPARAKRAPAKRKTVTRRAA